MRFTGAVLAGGASRRFGSDKARYLLDGRPLLARVLDSLAEAGERFVVAGRPYPEFGVPVHPDLIPGGGPLSGLHAALSLARHPLVAVAACDLPYLTPGYWRLLIAELGGAAAVAALGPGGEPEPLAAVYTQRALPLVEERLRRGGYSLRRLLGELGARLIPYERVSGELGPGVLTNLNVPPG